MLWNLKISPGSRGGQEGVTHALRLRESSTPQALKCQERTAGTGAASLRSKVANQLSWPPPKRSTRTY
eukprot:7965635-Pyramimonas_sp.AAC.1